jgi:transcriptional regulator with XRE-family HTH domain
LPERIRLFSSPTQAAVRLLGLEIASERKRRGLTAADLAERARISLMTLRNVERGVPSVAIGTVFEVAFLLGIELLGPTTDVERLTRRARDSIALLPQRVRPPADDVDDNF